VSIGADAARACGTVASARRRDDEAASAFARGLALDVGCSRPFERARLELAAGAHLRRVGQPRAAADLFATASRRLRALGAAPWADRCVRELDACGLRRRRRDGSDTGLTAREELVADAVARGLSNRECAAELGMSVKTVEHHVSRIYAKLGVASRTQLAVYLAAGAEEQRRAAPAAR
jgi:DNA-binding CsgD family transcriptional regulator